VNKKKNLFIILPIAFILSACGINTDTKEDVAEDSSNENKIESVKTDTSNQMDIMTEKELLEITGNEWALFNDEEKFDAVSNFMYIMSEKENWTYEFSETDYIDLVDDFYSDGKIDVQFASAFIMIKTLEENQ